MAIRTTDDRMTLESDDPSGSASRPRPTATAHGILCGDQPTYQAHDGPSLCSSASPAVKHGQSGAPGEGAGGGVKRRHRPDRHFICLNGRGRLPRAMSSSRSRW
jgi:hypothetical protein